MNDVFFHDAVKKVVYCCPAEPEVVKKVNSWLVGVTLQISRADNCIDPRTNQWKHKVRLPLKETYNFPDSRQAAIQHFKNSKYPPYPEIKADEYLQLKAKYEQQAESNQKNS